MLSIWRCQFYFPLFLLLSVSASQAVGMMFVKLPRPQSLALLASISCASRLFCSRFYKGLEKPVEKALFKGPNAWGFLTCTVVLYLYHRYLPAKMEFFGGYCYFTSRACASWLTAESNCSTMSSNLVTVHNQEENVYIQHRHNGERSWIGLNDRSVEGSFVWTNKEISKFRFWAPQQPNDWKNEDCVHTLGAKHGYTWNDVPCHNCYNYTCFKGTRHSKIYIYVNPHEPERLLDIWIWDVFNKHRAHTAFDFTQKTIETDCMEK